MQPTEVVASLHVGSDTIVVYPSSPVVGEANASTCVPLYRRKMHMFRNERMPLNLESVLPISRRSTTVQHGTGT